MQPMPTAAFDTLAAARRADPVTRADLSAMEARMTWRMVGIALAVNGALAAVLGGLLVAVLDRLP